MTYVLTVSDPSPQAVPLSGPRQLPPSADWRICTDFTSGAAGLRHLVASHQRHSAPSPPPPPPSPAVAGITAVCARVQENEEQHSSVWRITIASRVHVTGVWCA